MAKTASAAKAEMKKLTKCGGECVVYQFPAGHWSAATVESEVGGRLLATGEIYKGVKAQHFERFTI